MGLQDKSEVDKEFSWRPESFIGNSTGVQVAKKITENDPFGAGKAGMSAFGAIGNAFGWSSHGDRNKKNAMNMLIMQAYLEKQARIKYALDRSKSGKLSEGEQAGIDQYKTGQQANLRQSLASMGISDSSASVSGEGAIDTGAAAMKQEISDSWWAKAMQIQGMKAQSLNYIMKMKKEEQDSRIATFDALLQSVGAMGSIYANSLK